MVDLVASSDGDARTVRGGSWIAHAVDARAAYRLLRHRGGRYRYQGFRLALRSPSPDRSRPGGPGVLGLGPVGDRASARPEGAPRSGASGPSLLDRALNALHPKTKK